MPTWTPQQLHEYQTRHQARRLPRSAKPQPIIRNEPMATPAREAGYANRIHVHVVSFRRRLCDPDNLCPKYFVDCLRYAAYIPDDRPQDITLQVEQIKVKTRAEERTEIDIT